MNRRNLFTRLGALATGGAAVAVLPETGFAAAVEPAERSSMERYFIAAWSAEELRSVGAEEAALNPPPEPEIPVSDGMLEAADAAWTALDQCAEDGRTALSDRIAAGLYRAMEAQRRKGMASSTGDYRHKRASDAFGAPWLHLRRKDDKP